MTPEEIRAIRHADCLPGETCKLVPVPEHACADIASGGKCSCEPGCGYIRVSAVMAREELHSPDLQGHDIGTFANHQKIKIVKVVCDINKTGTSFTKRRVGEIIEDIKAKQYTSVVMLMWSRWGRNARESLNYLAQVDEAGGKVRAAAEDFDTSTSVGELTIGQMLLIAQFQSRQTSESWRRVFAKRLREGLPPSGKPMFGYTYDPKDGYKIDPVTGPLLERAYADVIGGKSTYEIAAEWNAAGIRTARGNRFTRQSVSRIMDLGFAAGYIRRHTKPRTAEQGGVHSRKHYDVWADGAQPQIISRETWQAYCDRMDAIAKLPPRLRRAVHALSGLLYCQLCADHPEQPRETRMVACYYARSDRYNWVCKRAIEDKTLHRRVQISDKIATEQILAWVEKQAGHVDVTAEAERIATLQKITTSADSYEAEIKRLIRKRKTVTNLMADEKIDQGDGEEQLVEIKKQLATAEAGLAGARIAAASQGMDRVRMFKTLAEEWEGYTAHGRREALACLVKKIMMVPGEPWSTATLVPVEAWQT